MGRVPRISWFQLPWYKNSFQKTVGQVSFDNLSNKLLTCENIMKFQGTWMCFLFFSKQKFQDEIIKIVKSQKSQRKENTYFNGRSGARTLLLPNTTSMLCFSFCLTCHIPIFVGWWVACRISNSSTPTLCITFFPDSVFQQFFSVFNVFFYFIVPSLTSCERSCFLYANLALLL